MAKIKAEIERRKKALHCTLFNDEYNDLLSFLDTLEEPFSDAVEGTIDDCGTPARLRLEMPGGSFRIGDKVRVIVLPKEGEK